MNILACYSPLTEYILDRKVISTVSLLNKGKERQPAVLPHGLQKTFITFETLSIQIIASPLKLVSNMTARLKVRNGTSGA